MMWTILKEDNLSKDFWAEVVACTIYLLNKYPTKSMQNMTPQEALSGEKPIVSYLRVFGCVAHAQIRRQKEIYLMIVEKNTSSTAIMRYPKHTKFII
jgi:hypothetical protein